MIGLQALIGGIGLIAQGLAAWWWFKASGAIPDNIDTFIGALNVSASYSKKAARRCPGASSYGFDSCLS
jgi:hypothetical protein